MRLRRQPKEQAEYPRLMIPNPDSDEATSLYVQDDMMPLVSYLLGEINTLRTAVNTHSQLLHAAKGNIEGAYFDIDGVYNKLAVLSATVIDLNTRLMQLEGDEYEDNDE